MNFPSYVPLALACVYGLSVTWSNARASDSTVGGTGLNLRQYIAKEVSRGKKVITIPRGRYELHPEGRVHLRFERLNDITIEAAGVELICKETTRAIDMIRCKNFRIRGLKVDYDPLPFTQGRIVGIAPDRSWIEFELMQGYPGNPGTHVEIFDQKAGTLKSTTHYGWRELADLGNGRHRIAKAVNYAYDPSRDREEIGDIMVFTSGNAPGGEMPHGIVSEGCIGLSLESVEIYASNCFSFFELNCEGSAYLGCKVVPRPPEQDLVKREFRRIRSGNADAFHSKHAIKGPRIVGCTALFQGDDCVNICGDYFFVAGAKGNEIKVLPHKDLNIEIGDTIEVVTYNGSRVPSAKVIGIRKGDLVSNEERAFLARQRLDEGIKKKLLDLQARSVLLTVESNVELPMGSVVASERRMGNGFEVRNNNFGFNRSRGILIKASHGRIADNILTECWGPGILVSPEWWWLESGSSDYLDIANNRIDRGKGTAIVITAYSGDGSTDPIGAHRNIRIEGNRISGSSVPCMKISSVTGLKFGANYYDAAPIDKSSPFVQLRNCTE